MADINITITQELLLLITEIDEFKGKWRALNTLAPDRLAALRKIATIESVGSSTRIEGARLSDRQVQELLANVGKQSFTSRDEQEVAGYAEVMDAIFASWESIPFSENYIKQFHKMLLKYSPKDERHRGEYKNSNSVQAFDADGNSLGIVFETTSAFDTPRQTQGTLNSERQPNWEPWLLFFLRVLQRQKNRLQTKIDNERMMASTLPLLSVRILELAKEHGRVTTQSIEQATGESRSTIKARLKQLTIDRLLLRYGNGRSTWYGLG